MSTQVSNIVLECLLVCLTVLLSTFNVPIPPGFIITIAAGIF